MFRPIAPHWSANYLAYILSNHVAHSCVWTIFLPFRHRPVKSPYTLVLLIICHTFFLITWHTHARGRSFCTPPSSREVALYRFELLRPHLQEARPLRTVASEAFGSRGTQCQDRPAVAGFAGRTGQLIFWSGMDRDGPSTRRDRALAEPDAFSRARTR